jgi:hypothetical protein
VRQERRGISNGSKARCRMSEFLWKMSRRHAIGCSVESSVGDGCAYARTSWGRKVLCCSCAYHPPHERHHDRLYERSRRIEMAECTELMEHQEYGVVKVAESSCQIGGRQATGARC